MFAVFVERGSADNLNFATRQGRLQNGCRIDGAFSGASADKGMQLVNEQDDVARLLNFLNALLQTLFEFTTVLGKGFRFRASLPDGNGEGTKRRAGSAHPRRLA